MHPHFTCMELSASSIDGNNSVCRDSGGVRNQSITHCLPDILHAMDRDLLHQAIDERLDVMRHSFMTTKPNEKIQQVTTNLVSLWNALS